MLTAACGHQALQRLVSGVGDRGVRLVALRHHRDIWCDIAWQAQSLGQDLSRVALTRPETFEVDARNLRNGNGTPTDVVLALTESGHAATQPRNAPGCRWTLGYSVCGVSQQ